MKTLITTGLALALMTGSASAGPAADKAQAHIDAIAKGDVAAITAAYGSDATLHWVGGPLDGTYAGMDRMKKVWGKFAAAQGPLKASVANVLESANPKGATVVANVTFAGKNTVKVRHVMLFREDKLVSETWQVDPSL